ncbi:SURF1 family protein [Paracoccus sediminicola]|uniref:SURF1 family protein n=1 Tax=Paracoccus sediminicola TaxID=3017783 RepID=UPI0022F0467B|nr:SURF1 family protein [Paracoccus sediminicola]WBU57291.1 SURF1 family protein [Paracoccus sediminicola]
MSKAGSEPRRPLWLVAVILLLGAILFTGFAGLGVWQIQRLGWKRDLIATVEARVDATPIGWAEAAALPADQREYRRVSVSGRFDHSAETLVKAVTERGGGYWVLTPLETQGGEVLLINRGFVPTELQDAASRPDGQVEGRQEITGLMRLSEPGGAFLRDNDPAADRWYSRDVAAIAAASDLDSAAPVFIDADATATPQPGGYPVGGLTVVDFRNAHLSYALTWFALAGMVGFGMVLLLRQEASQRHRRA